MSEAERPSKPRCSPARQAAIGVDSATWASRGSLRPGPSDRRVGRALGGGAAPSRGTPRLARRGRRAALGRPFAGPAARAPRPRTERGPARDLSPPPAPVPCCPRSPRRGVGMRSRHLARGDGGPGTGGQGGPCGAQPGRGAPLTDPRAEGLKRRSGVAVRGRSPLRPLGRPAAGRVTVGLRYHVPIASERGAPGHPTRATGDRPAPKAARPRASRSLPLSITPLADPSGP